MMRRLGKLNNIDFFELAEVVNQAIQDKIDDLKMVDFAEVKAVYALENGGYSAEVLLPGATVTTNPLNCLLGYIPKVGDWSVVLYPRNTAPILIDATPMRENDVSQGTGYAPAAHNHDGVYSPVGHDHDDRYYTKVELTPDLKTPTLISPWVVDPAGVYTAPGYYKDMGKKVYLSGVAFSGTIGSNIFQLPAGYRPAKKIFHVTISRDLGGAEDLASVEISPDGYVLAKSGSGPLFSLEGISFLTP
jgi:hypothetical protein